MQVAAQIWDEDHHVFKNCNTWAAYEFPHENDDGAVLCNGGIRTGKDRQPKYYEPCPARPKCRTATDHVTQNQRPPEKRHLPLAGNWGPAVPDNKLAPGAVSAQRPPPAPTTVISPEQVLSQFAPPTPAVAAAPPPPPPTLAASAGFEERLAAAKTSLAQARETVQRSQAQRSTSPYKWSGISPDPKLHATPVVPPTTHPAGMQSPYAHDPLFQHQIPVFVPTSSEDIGMRLFFNILQSMVASAGYALFSYARVVDLFAGLLR